MAVPKKSKKAKKPAKRTKKSAKKWDPVRALGIHITCNELLEEAQTKYKNNAAALDDIRTAISKCLQSLKKAGDQIDIIYWPPCPSGWKREGRKCVPSE